ncbi:MAG TPA: hypothetical protein VEB21_14120 [Terriglobales bacterium]|nr:hypothetical protein [Terriglobales bacterium]
MSWRGGAMLLAAIAVIAGQAALRHDPTSAAATLLFLVAAFALALCLRRIELPPLPVQRRAATGATGSDRVAAAICLAASALGIAYASYRLSIDWSGSFYLGWGLLLAGATTASVGLRQLDGPNSNKQPWPWWETAALVTIVAFGLWLRAHRLGEFPDGYTTHAIEEQQTGLGGYRILHQNIQPWEFFFDYQMTALAIWLDAVPNFTTIRVPYVIVSALTVIPAHFLLRQLLHRPAAVAGTFLYAALSWNLLYSRCAHPIFPTNLLVILIFALIVQFGRSGRLAAAPWIGLLSGATLYSYAGFRGTALFAAVFLAMRLIGSLWRGDRGGAARTVAAGAVFGAFLGASALPLRWLLQHAPGNYYFEAFERALANRSYYTAETAAFFEQRIERLREVGKIFMHVGDGSPTFNFPGEPMLDPIVSCLAVVGLFLMILRPRRAYNAYFLFVAAVLLLVGTVFVHNLDVRRLQGITIFVVLAAAHTAEHFWAIAADCGRLGRSLLIGAAAFVAAGTAAFSYDLYYVRMANDAAIRRAFKDYYTTIIRFGQQEAQGKSILLASIVHRFFDPSYHYRYNYSWLIDASLSGRNLLDVTELIGLGPRSAGGLDSGSDAALYRAQRQRRDEPSTVVVQRPFEGDAVAAMVQRLYPQAQCRDSIEPDNPWVGLKVCELPKDTAPLALEMQLQASYWTKRDSNHRPALTRDEPFIGYAVVPPLCHMPQPGKFCEAEWRGTFEVSPEVDTQLKIDAIGHTTYTATIDGRRVRRLPHPLRPGSHTLEISAQLPRDPETGLRVSWIRDGKEEVLPFYR